MTAAEHYPPHVTEQSPSPYSALELRQDIRAIMRNGGRIPQDVADRSWWAEDLVREITEWHDAGRPTPDPARTICPHMMMVKNCIHCSD